MAARLVLPVSAESPRQARQVVASMLLDRGLGAHTDTACLLVSELVTNAVLHARSEAELDVDLADHLLRVSVRDRDDHEPEPESPGPWSSRGRGLMLVETFATRWGVDLAPRGGKSVWFELDLHQRS